MAATAASTVLGTPAPDFRLARNGRQDLRAEDIAGTKGTVIVFICNHCPYVKAVIDRLVADAKALMAEGIGFAAICSNDAEGHPEDSFDNMQRFAEAHGFPFPYLHDENQSVARAYGAVCTPDFFGYDAERKLQYRGRLDEGRTTAAAQGPPRARRGHARDRRAAGRPPIRPLGRLLHQMEGGVAPRRGLAMRAPPSAASRS